MASAFQKGCEHSQRGRAPFELLCGIQLLMKHKLALATSSPHAWPLLHSPQRFVPKVFLGLELSPVDVLVAPGSEALQQRRSTVVWHQIDSALVPGIFAP